MNKLTSGPSSASATNYTVGRDKGLLSPGILKWKQDVHRQFLTLARVPEQRLTWMTILAQPIVVDVGKHSKAVSPILEDFRDKMISRCRRKLPSMRIRGAFEIDVLHRWLAGDKTHKEAFMSSMGVEVAAVGQAQRILLPHLHAVVDIGKHDQTKVREEFAAEFPGQWRVVCRPLHTDKTVRQNLINLASYSSKLKVAYSDWHPDRQTRFGPLYEDCWQRVVQEIIEGIDMSKMIFRHGGA